MRKTTLLLAVLLYGILSFGRQLPFKPIDSVYSETIRSVQFFPVSSIKQQYPLPPVASIVTQSLGIYFDELGENPSNFNAAIYHCNADWSQSGVRELDYLSEYNEFNLGQGELSFSTRIAFTHYAFRLPRVRYSGNYMLVIYRDYDPQNIVITRRFSIYQKKIEVEAQGSVMARGATQGIDFNVYYGDMGISSPLTSMKTFVRQNGVDQNTVGNMAPTFMSGDKMQYKAISAKTIFEGGNEFRRFDLRSVEFNGFNITNINKNTTPISVYLYPDKKRANSVYQEDQDINGNYVIDQYEYSEGNIQSDYINTYFKLEIPKTNDDIYVYGALTDWKLLEEFKMRWDETEGFYFCRPLLKQGYYNYAYAKNVKGKASMKSLEGSYAYTENLYEVFVYYRNLNGLYDELIGYKKLILYPKN